MNYHDVALLNNSLDSLSEALLRKQMLAQQAQARAQQTGLESQRLGIDQARWQATQAHQQRLESKADEANALATKRSDVQEKQQTLGAIMQANTAGMLDEDAISKVNDWLAKDEHFGPVGLQLTKSSKPTPQAGQNAAAQLAQQIAHWSDVMDNGESDQRRAIARQNYDFLSEIQKQMVAPKAEKPSIKVKTGGGMSGQPEVTEELTRSEFADRNRPKTLDAQTAAAILKEVGGDKQKARALAVQRGYTIPQAGQ